MTKGLFREWYVHVFLPSVREFQLEKGQSYKVLLILDNATCHLSEEEINGIDDMCCAELLPSNVTSSIQPMKQGVIEKMKKLFRKSLLREMLLLEDHLSILEFLKARNMKTCCTQIAGAWQEITNADIYRAWRKLILSCDIDSSKCDATSLVDDYLQLLNRIPGFQNLTPKEVTAWLAEDANDPGWEVMDIQKFLSSTQNTATGIENFTMKEEPMDVKIKEELSESNVEEIVIKNEPAAAEAVSTGDQALAACQKFIEYKEWFETQEKCEPEHLIILQKLHELNMEIASHRKVQ